MKMSMNVGKVGEGECEHSGLEWGTHSQNTYAIAKLLSFGTIILS